MNELSKETSPYLLQHAHNPVFWKAWNDEALASAKAQQKLLIISVGYSACHWCHVMEHETFEDATAASVMNADFVCIKVDREERPDVDAVYMKAVQIMTGRGGWPLNVVALPDGRPVWGGTYFRKEEWMESLAHLAHMWQTEPGRMTEYADKLLDAVDALALPLNPTPEVPAALDPLVAKWKRSFDHEYGGMARAPKFMMPCNYRFLIAYATAKSDTALADFVDLTLTRMAWGGLFDTVGGGFSRYSVDMRWHVPHFEKMLYDNAQLVSLYAEAFSRTGSPLYREVIDKTLSFVSRELANGEGGFFSALDADSLNAAGKSEEGAFYTWTKPELEACLGDELPLFSQVFHIDDFGHWEHGQYVLIQDRPLSDIAAEAGLEESALAARKHQWEQRLFEWRENRPRPSLDDKTLTGWNALIIRGFADAFGATGVPSYAENAVRAGQFILSKLMSAEGSLWRTYKNGKASIGGFLEDYATTIDAFLALYTVSFDESWLHHAKALADETLDRFYDPASGFFSFRPLSDDVLVAGHYEIEDNVIPASNSIMADNLFRLGVYFVNPHYRKVATRMVAGIIPGIDYPSAFANWMRLELLSGEQVIELAIVGEGALEATRLLQSEWHPQLIIAASETASNLPFLNGRFVENRLQLYVCQNNTCGLPVDNLEDARAQWR